MKTISTVIISAALLFRPEVQAQIDQTKLEKKRDEAERLFDQFDYPEAAQLYEEIASALDDQFIYLRIAACYHKTGNLISAEEWYLKATAKELPVEAQYNYAEVLMSNGKYDEARKWYQLHTQNAPHDNRSKKKLATIAQIASYHENEKGYEIHTVDINSPYSDFGPAFYKDGIVFASAREEVAPGKRYNRTNSAYLDLFLSRYDENGVLGPPEKLSKEVNTKYHEGPATIYDDGNKMIFTRNNFYGKTNKKEDNTIRLQLFYTDKTEGKSWNKPIRLFEEQYSFGHPSVSQDGNLLYFASDMPGGSGGTDLYVSQFSNDQWGKPKNLGEEVNTMGNEMFPFISQNGILYFASDGHGGLGGLDIFQTNLTGEGPVENLGAPVNSGRDDFAFAVNPLGDWGYFSSNRKGGAGDDDLYRFTVKRPVPDKAPIQEDTVTVVNKEPEYVYTVQILALLNPKTVHRSFLQDLQGVLKHNGKDGFHRYTYGEYTGLDHALETLEVMKAKGYHDAFIRKVRRYRELSDGPGREVEKLYLAETRDPVF